MDYGYTIIFSFQTRLVSSTSSVPVSSSTRQHLSDDTDGEADELEDEDEDEIEHAVGSNEIINILH